MEWPHPTQRVFWSLPEKVAYKAFKNRKDYKYTVDWFTGAWSGNLRIPKLFTNQNLGFPIEIQDFDGDIHIDSKM